MTSLTDVYRHRMGAVASRSRVLAGLALFALGAAMIAMGVVLATTGVSSALGLGTYSARELAGVLAGLGLPATFLGVFAVLPASRVTRASAAIGASLSVFAVALFTYAYPVQWPGAPAADPLLALTTLTAYFVGAITTAWCLFVALATLRTRKSPGGTAEMHVTEEGRIELVRELGATGQSGGGIGFFGTDPDGEVPTQTGPDGSASTAPTASDGGATASTPTRGQPDRYCGNCEHFHYVRRDGDIKPYCGLGEHFMEDLDACEEWSSNSPDRA